MKKYKDFIIIKKCKTKQYKEMEKLAKKLNISKKEMEKRLNSIYIMEGSKYEDYFIIK
ncbi:MAG: hypothetical protein RSD29_02210 [Bacilli bacterium]